jgi:predicted MFS family arabinose efflux permease
MVIHKNRQQDIEKFNIERARLAVALPMIYIGAICILAYGWVMQYRTSLAGPIVMLYFLGITTSGAFNTLNTLVVDTNSQSAATAVAANNLCRCLMGAGTTAFVGPLIDAIGIGWTGTVVAVLYFVCSPVLWLVYLRGYSWRQKEAARDQRESSTSSEEVQEKAGVERGPDGGQS